MRARRRTAAALLLSAALALTGCGAGDASDSGADEKPALSDAGAARQSAAPGYAAEDHAATGEDGKKAERDEAAKNPADAAAGRHIVRTASVSVAVKDAAKALAGARAAAERAGGHVENESTERLDDSSTTSRVVLRVPQREYDSVLAELSGAGKLLSREANAKDVTEQVVDVESRIATQRASVARVRELMDRAEKLSDVVTLEGELSNRQAELESLLAKQASLKDRTSLATITVELTEHREEKKARDEDPGFLDALGGGWDALVAAVRWLTVAVGALLPFAAVAAVLYAAWRLLRRRRGARAESEPAAPASPAARPSVPLPSAPPVRETDGDRKGGTGRAGGKD
ncbi:DUF4349 domain-containing protein [Streptomyces sp. NPDC005805]|uniref:DUF4349 domain-containing protein n=1 Tax=Streptomyces sp. NPDC005805 TaxID=3157068 RepID=UPI0034015394